MKGAPLRLAGTRSARLRLDRPPWGLGYLLVGDAAGLVHPFTGEGIAFALHSGRAAAELVASGLSDDELGHRYEEDALSFAGDVYNLPRTAMLFALPCHLPPAVRSVYLGSLPALDVLRKGAKQLRRRTAGAARAGGG